MFCSFSFSRRGRHTRLQGDWSSDVCSSDLLEVWTNGTGSPADAVGLAATLLRDHLTIFVNAEVETALEGEGVGELPENLAEYLNKSVDELELSVRSANCLKNAGIRTVRDLDRKSVV